MSGRHDYVRPIHNHVRPTRYGSHILELSSFDNVIYIARFVIFYASQLMDDIMPTLTGSGLAAPAH